jgi:YVTN family beta-propeller protein
VEGKPYAVVATEEIAYLSLQDRAEVIAVRLQDGYVLQRIPTPESPTALALWGDFLYVTHFWSGAFSLIYLPSGEVVRTIQPALQAGLSASIEIDPIAGVAYLPQTIVNATAGATLANQHIPVVQVIDLSTLQVQRTINLVVADRPVSMPLAARLAGNRARLYVASAGSDAVSVMNLQTDSAEAHLETGSYPQAILLNRDSTRIYVQDGISGTLTVLDTRFFGLEDQIPTATIPIDSVYLLGARLFHNALDPRLSQTSMTACASCHADRGADGRQWYGATTLPVSSADSIQPQWLLEHLKLMQGGDGFAQDSLDMQALVRYLRD